jgi:hypothetical protein
LEQHEMEYLYSDGSHHHFMNTADGLDGHGSPRGRAVRQV